MSWGSLDTESPLKLSVAMSRLGQEPILELLPALRRRHERYVISDSGGEHGTFQMVLRAGSSRLHAVRGRAAPGLHALEIASVPVEQWESGPEDGHVPGEPLRVRLWVLLH